jgi:hypothetical protein
MGVKSLKSKMERYAEGNLEAAQIIIADSDRYQGVMQEWAARTIALFHIENPSRQAEAAPQPAEARLKAAEIISADSDRYLAMMQSWAASMISRFRAASPREVLSLEDRSEISELTSKRR